MARQETPFQRMAERVGPVTAGTIVLLIAGTLLAPAFTLWLRLANVFELVAMEPFFVRDGQVWRLITYPWVVTDNQPVVFLLNLFLTIWVLTTFMRAVESMWGFRKTIVNLVILIVAPAIMVTLLSFVVHNIGFELGPTSIVTAFIVAYACEFRGVPIQFMLVPVRLDGDRLIVFEGVMLAALIIVKGTILAFIVPVMSFFFAIAWFRLGWGVNLRRSWLHFRKGRIESRMKQARRRSNLRVVSSRDDDDEPKQYLH